VSFYRVMARWRRRRRKRSWSCFPRRSTRRLTASIALTHEYGLKTIVDNAWRATSRATPLHDRMTLCSRIPASAPIDRLLANHLTYPISFASPSLSRGRFAKCMSEASIHKDIKPANIW